MTNYAGNVDKTATIANKWQQGEGGGKGAVIITLQRLFDDVGVFAIMSARVFYRQWQTMAIPKPSMAIPALFITISMPSGCSFSRNEAKSVMLFDFEISSP